MNAIQRTPLILALIAGVALAAAGCSDREAPRNAATSQDRPVDKMATPAPAAATRAGVAVDDTFITTSVKSAVLAEPGLASLQIQVDTKDGIVTLSGTVDNAALKSRAAQIAQNTDGVRSVVDNLAIKTG